MVTRFNIEISEHQAYNNFVCSDKKTSESDHAFFSSLVKKIKNNWDFMFSHEISQENQISTYQRNSILLSLFDSFPLNRYL